MKVIGLIGGMSCESSAEYYKGINKAIQAHLGGLSSAKLILNSLNFQEIYELQKSGNWTRLQEIIIQAGQSLERAGADCVLICTNLMHKYASELKKNISIPLIHIAKASGELMQAQGIKKILLLGTIYTMEEDFYAKVLLDNFGIETIIPSPEDRIIVSNIIYEELCKGVIRPESRQEYLRIINKAPQEGASAALLACTEIPLLLKNGDANIPLFETTQIHIDKAVEFALNPSAT